MSQNRYYKQANLYNVLTTLTQILAGPGTDQSNRLFSLFIENTGSTQINVVLVDNQGDATSFIIPLNAGSPGITLDNLPWELVAGGVFATAVTSASTILAGLWSSDIKREALGAMSQTVQNIPAPSSYDIQKTPLTILEYEV